MGHFSQGGASRDTIGADNESLRKITPPGGQQLLTELDLVFVHGSLLYRC